MRRRLVMSRRDGDGESDLRKDCALGIGRPGADQPGRHHQHLARREAVVHPGVSHHADVEQPVP